MVFFIEILFINFFYAMICLFIFYWIFSTLFVFGSYIAKANTKWRVFIGCVICGPLLFPFLLGEIMSTIYDYTDLNYKSKNNRNN